MERNLQGLSPAMTTANMMSFFLLLTVALPARAQTPNPAGEPEWISVSGTVVSTHSDSFRLDYGQGIVTVSVDNWDWLRGGRELIANHRVMVFGRVDETVQNKRMLRAAGMYDEDLSTYYDIARWDPETRGLWTMTKPLAPGYIEVAGRVARVSGRELVLSSGMRVDTRKLGYDPVDDKGYPQIGLGDRIKVAGYLAKDILESPELVAAWLVELSGQESP